MNKKGVWNTTEGSITCLAPMADVTDAAFRRIIATYGKPDLMWTEFVSADGLFLRPGELSPEPTSKLLPLQKIAQNFGIGWDNPLLKDLWFTEVERPIIAQFFSRNEERMRKAARLAVALGFDGIDINMGCPARVICKQGAGAAMIRDPEHAKRIIQATVEGAQGLPVSVKTRIGYGTNEIETWLPALLETNIRAIILHARTKKEMSKVPARWEIITQAVEIRDSLDRNDVAIIGNGDVRSYEDARTRIQKSGSNGVMIGRGMFGNPWFFKDIQPSLQEKLQVMLEHTQLFEQLIGGSYESMARWNGHTKSFALMKKHYKAYVSGFPEAKELRLSLMETENTQEVENVLSAFGF